MTYASLSLIEHIDGGQLPRSKQLMHTCSGNPQQMRGKRDRNTNQLITVRSSISPTHHIDPFIHRQPSCHTVTGLMVHEWPAS